ncbi:TPA_asm: coat protein [ssRNA phage Esthiorhiza.2_14]|uniref:Coat protein n=2 Tax=Fiersviridae TaxID=2842319 RepID=A0A8S5L1H1_9VIRU|nr:coat protein [ssRNA phage Esthiorhiza.2_14]QDH88146.1 MAG: hypothetical protein H2RhizoLitter491315_000002 [Leviviridae sp.]DAD51489.1 TPA_asm: coat protein [ssRNA phage Esthiorhiza.2_14]
MAAIATIALLDGQATPVSHNFNPVTIDSAGVAKWADRSGGISIGFPTLTYSLRNPTKGSTSYKLAAKVVLPVLEQTSPSTATGIQPAPTVAYSLLANIDLVLPERSVLLDRNNLLAYARNFLANATVITAGVQNYESVY